MALPFLFADNARSTLGASLSIGGTTITLASGGGALFPNPGPGQQFALTLNDAATQALFETVWCTARAGDVLTVIRAQEGTNALAWGVGDFCWNGPTAGQMNNLVQTPHMVDASIAPTFAATQVQGTFSATGPATFSSSGSFGSAVTATDPNSAASGGMIVANSGANGARIRLQGTPGTSGTPNKTIRAVNGILDVQNSAATSTIFSLSDLGDVGAIRSLTASGSGSFGGTITSASSGTFTDPGVGGVVVLSGPSGANLSLRGTGTTPNKSLRALNNRLEFVNSGYSTVIAALDDLGNFSATGFAAGASGINSTGPIAGGSTISGVAISSNNGNITANNGALRATIGAFGSGDPNRATLLGDFVNTGSEMRLPNGWIAQWGSGGVGCTITQTEGGFTWFYGVAPINFTQFPTTLAAAFATAVDIAGHLVVNANVNVLSNSSIQVVPHASAVIGVNFYWLVIGY